jgi:hypothetical protein
MTAKKALKNNVVSLFLARHDFSLYLLSDFENKNNKQKGGINMSKWEELKSNLSVIADKTIKKTKELTDTASLKIKIASKEADRDIEYKNLGRLTYLKLKDTDTKDPEALTKQISESIEKLDTINEEIITLKKEDELRKKAKKAEKEEAKKKAEEEAEQEEELIMEQFNEARREADAEYEKAKEAANSAKTAQ